ncbi:HK97 family phage portal protein [Peptoanaerobacter stomatis]|uniref:HK97 family phage portal protein n=1 Tax=Peptoanaerobacter stomatis TaxID=796937 RepID=V9HVB9_9FIRM|nr:phage portal protein [Peptoanaerobacter stomatis]EHL17397.1 HK97 family phage portal protein [Peptoanaerobacter stomatis]
MNFFQKLKSKARAEPIHPWFLTTDAYDTLCISGYQRLDTNPEIRTCVHKIANLISSMTIYLMENGEKGDNRIKNELSRKLDVNPCSYMTRKNFIYWIVSTMLLEGKGNSIVFPKIDSAGLIDDLIPIQPGVVNILVNDKPYTVNINGKDYTNDDVLHFAYNPASNEPWKGKGFTVELKDLVETLAQATKTKKGFMSDKWKPSVIISVDAMTDEFASEDGREKILKRYISDSQAGKPWVIPADMIKVDTLKPLSLQDLAITDTVKLDKQTIAGLIGVPAFFLGVGEFNKDEYNNFVDTTILPIAQVIEQELTKKLLYSPNLYFKFNPRSLYNYSLTEMVGAGGEMVKLMAMSRNELRNWLGMSPREDMEELLALENYIPQDKLGDQLKLLQGGDNNAKDE